MLKWLDLVDERNHSLVYKSLLPQQGHINVNPVFPAFHLLFPWWGENWWLGVLLKNDDLEFLDQSGKTFIMISLNFMWFWGQGYRMYIQNKNIGQKRIEAVTILWLNVIRCFTWIMIQNMSIFVCNIHTHNIFINSDGFSL